jgi:hypothetical protein
LLGDVKSSLKMAHALVSTGKRRGENLQLADPTVCDAQAANATQFGEAMAARGLTSLCTAAVVPGLTSQRVLTTEWVDGTRLDESAAGDEARLCGIALNGYC